MRATKDKGPPTRRPSISYTTIRLLRRRQRRRLLRGFGLERRLLLFLALGENELVALGRNLADLVHHGAGAGWDEPADDDVLREPIERVGLAVDGGFRQHAG